MAHVICEKKKLRTFVCQVHCGKPVHCQASMFYHFVSVGNFKRGTSVSRDGEVHNHCAFISLKHGKCLFAEAPAFSGVLKKDIYFLIGDEALRFLCLSKTMNLLCTQIKLDNLCAASSVSVIRTQVLY